MTIKLFVILVGLGLFIGSGVCDAQTGAAAATAETSPAATQGYVPPVRGAPARRVGGSSRGVDDELPNLVALVPDHVGLTTMEHPTLYWYLSKPTAVRIEITLIRESEIQPLIEASAGNAPAAGIHAIRLADHGVSLVPGVEYEWSVALVLNPDERSHDIISAGALMRVRPTADQKTRLGGIERNFAGLAYAQEGIWYDAIAALSEAIDADAANDSLRTQRARVLEQAGLVEPAAHDARFVSKAPRSPGNVIK